MRFVLTVVEQLDRAASELETDHPINNRLALILIDNAAELLIHRQCVGHLQTDRFYSRLWSAHESISRLNPEAELSGTSTDLQSSLLTAKQRTGASGIYFDPKLKVLSQKQDLSLSERRFISIAHGYRNELYHVGLSHDDVIRAIAGTYFLLTCDLFVRLGGAGFFGPTFSSSDVYSEVAQRYLQMRKGRIDAFSFDKEEVAGKIRSALPWGLPDLATTLACSVRNSIQEIGDDLEFLIRDNPAGFDKAKILEVAQWQKDLSDELEQQNVDGLWVDPSYLERYDEIASTLAENWQPQHRSLPDRRWLVRANAINVESDPLVALEKYESLRKDMSYLKQAIRSAAEGLDEAIQREVDRLRGK